mmetsp:Transcript_5455/g.9615  ORF Transcript_5455/g.9615 Transcript_5455/m.9615 type:complete len:206 (+) Transcript_5455:41-658(+)
MSVNARSVGFVSSVGSRFVSRSSFVSYKNLGFCNRFCSVPTAPTSIKPSAIKATFNFELAVKKKYEVYSFTQLVSAPVDALQGVGPKLLEVLNHYSIKTVQDLAQWKYAKASLAILDLSAFENTTEGHVRDPESKSSLEHILDKKYETMQFSELKDAPIDCLQGISKEKGEALSALKLGTVTKLAQWKLFHAAKSICILAEFEKV